MAFNPNRRHPRYTTRHWQAIERSAAATATFTRAPAGLDILGLRNMPSSRFFIGLTTLLLFSVPIHAIKFVLPASTYPPQKCIWNQAHANTLVIITANVGTAENQRTDIEIVDSTPQRNVYLAKKGIKAESRLAITTHAEGEVGVCFKNHVEGSELAYAC
jgi:hypothetical protein